MWKIPRQHPVWVEICKWAISQKGVSCTAKSWPTYHVPLSGEGRKMCLSRWHLHRRRRSAMQGFLWCEFFSKEVRNFGNVSNFNGLKIYPQGSYFFWYPFKLQVAMFAIDAHEIVRFLSLSVCNSRSFATFVLLFLKGHRRLGNSRISRFFIRTFPKFPSKRYRNA